MNLLDSHGRRYLRYKYRVRGLTDNIAKKPSPYYAEPPHIPSTLIKMNTSMIVIPNFSSEKIPTADSKARVVKMTAWTIAGTDRSLAGIGGIPINIQERERNTVVW